MSLQKKISYKLLNLFNSNNEDNKEDQDIINNIENEVKSLKSRTSSTNLNQNSFKSAFNKLMPNRRDSVIQSMLSESPPSPTLSTISHLTSSSDSSNYGLNENDFIAETTYPHFPMQKAHSSPIITINKIASRMRSNSHTITTQPSLNLIHTRSYSSSITSEENASTSNIEKSVKTVNKKSSLASNLSHLFKSSKSISIQENQVDIMELDLESPNRIPFQPFQHELKSNNKSVFNIEEMKAKKMFYYFKLIKNSILEGQHISSKLYVPKQVWYQDNISLPDIEDKVRRLQKLTASFNKLMETDFNNPCNIKNELKEIGKIITNFQYVKEKKNVMQYTLAEYSNILLNFIISSKHLEFNYLYLLKLKQVNDNSSIINILHPMHCITNYLIHTLLREVFNDITFLLTHYLSGVNNNILI